MLAQIVFVYQLNYKATSDICFSLSTMLEYKAKLVTSDLVSSFLQIASPTLVRVTMVKVSL